MSENRRLGVALRSGRGAMVAQQVVSSAEVKPLHPLRFLLGGGLASVR
jgi:hypothetical protein